MTVSGSWRPEAFGPTLIGNEISLVAQKLDTCWNTALLHVWLTEIFVNTLCQRKEEKTPKQTQAKAQDNNTQSVGDDDSDRGVCTA